MNIASEKQTGATLARTKLLGTLGGAATALMVLAGGQASAADQSPLFAGPFDMASKIYLSEVVSGASKGMRELGWQNPAMDIRIAAMEAHRPAQSRSEFAEAHDQGYQQALKGEWTEQALDGYLQVIETPLFELQVLNQNLTTIASSDFRQGVQSVFATEMAASAIAKTELETARFGNGTPLIQAVRETRFLASGPGADSAKDSVVRSVPADPFTVRRDAEARQTISVAPAFE